MRALHAMLDGSDKSLENSATIIALSLYIYWEIKLQAREHIHERGEGACLQTDQFEFNTLYISISTSDISIS